MKINNLKKWKIQNLFTRLNKKILDNWLIISLILICIGLFSQFFLAGSDLIFSTKEGMLMIIILFIILFFTWLQYFVDKIKIVKITTLLVGLVFGITGLFYIKKSCTDEMFFYKGKNISNQLTFNPKFVRLYPEGIQKRPNQISFIFITKQGDFNISHSCLCIIDANTWELFSLDEKKLGTFLKKDIKKRITQSFSDCSLSEIEKLTKVFFYKNGRFSSAELRESNQ